MLKNVLMPLDRSVQRAFLVRLGTFSEFISSAGTTGLSDRVVEWIFEPLHISEIRDCTTINIQRSPSAILVKR